MNRLHSLQFGFRHWQILLFALAISVSICFQLIRGEPCEACTDNSADSKDSPSKAEPLPASPTFQDQIRPLLEAKCVRCHGGKTRRKDLDLGSPAGIQKGSESGPVIVPGKPGESLLFEKIHSGKMPPAKKDRLNEAEIETIRRWIVAGAKFKPQAGSTNDNRSIADSGSGTTHADVIPILLRRCTVCHGPHRQEGSLDLRSKASILRGGKSGPAIVPGKPEESFIIKKTRSGQMPPRDRLVEASVKPIEQSEIEVIARWISAGAPESPIDIDVASTEPDTLVTDKDRNFWAFQPVKPVAIPVADHPSQVRNPIDAFIWQKLEQKGLRFAPEADRATLIRRAYFDLTGLPPDPGEVQAFLSDRNPDAYEKLIDRILASPRYGERWGRFWLDLAGYADSEGKREQDLPRPAAWRYRDYVIRSLNADKPYDRFLLEQLAGDELADYERAPEITDEIYDNLVATGFLRMVPDATWANITGYVPDRLEVIADEIDVLGSAVMGLTIKCARCHSHKFDPIPQRDYYRLTAIFKGAYDEFDWLKPDVRPGLGPVSQDIQGGRFLPFVTTAEKRAWENRNTKLQKQINALNSEIDHKASVLTAKIRNERLAHLPEVLRTDLKTMLKTRPEKRDAIQKYLADKFEKQLTIDRDTLKKVDPEFKKESEEKEGRIRNLQAQVPPEPKIQALWDRGDPSPTFLYRRGDSLTPGRQVGAGVPSVLTNGKTPFEAKAPWPGAKKTGRRLAFARWLIQPDHPLTARVEVNRIWKNHFGSGIVKTLGNFGKTGTPPTHPELLDWLTKEFVQQGWSLKSMHRLMMTSATYRQSSSVSSEQEKLDPANDLFSRMPLARLDAEALYDTLLLVAGRLDETRFGPADGVKVRPDGLVTPAGTDRGWRRLIYVQQVRKQISTNLEVFDFPQMNPNCIERRDSTVATQALYLMNNNMVHDLAQNFARRIKTSAGTDRAKMIEQIYLIALSRYPTDEEKKVGMDALAQLAEAWSNQPAFASNPDAIDQQALATFCHAIVNSAGFLYVD
jgi:mono/diheme cytochrome c family protein